MDRIVLDVRHAWRSLRRRPGASLAATGVLALGLGLSTAMFALADPYLFRPLPYSRPHELVAIQVRSDGLTPEAAIPRFAEWQARTDLFQGLAAYASSGVRSLRFSDRSLLVPTAGVTSNFFDVLGVPVRAAPSWHDSAASPPPALFLPRATAALPLNDLTPGTVLAGQNGDDIQAAGVLPAEFLYPDHQRTRYLVALTAFAPEAVIRVGRWTDDGQPRSASAVQMIGRLRPGLTPSMVADALSDPLPSGRRLSVTVVPLRELMISDRHTLALGALGAGVLVLLVCAGNVANLWLAAGLHRGPEMATRAALGASRADLTRLWATETLLTTSTAVGAGVLLAAGVLRFATGVMPEAYATMAPPVLSARSIIFALLVGGGLVALGLVPGLVVRRRAGTAAVRAAIGGSARSGRIWRVVFVAAQAALAMVLAVGAALLARSYAGTVLQDPGFDSDTSAVMVAFPSTLRDERLDDAVDRVRQGLRRVPGIEAVASAKGNIVNGRLSTSTTVGIDIEGRTGDADLRIVSPGFFEVAGMTMVAGRPLGPEDAAGPGLFMGPGVVVNEAFVTEHLGGGFAVGRAMGSTTVVGVVQDAYEKTWVRQPEATVYSLGRLRTGGDMTFLLRTSEPFGQHESAIRSVLREIEPDAIVIEAATLGGKLADTVRDRSFATLVLGLFGVSAGAVTIAGLMAMVAFIVARRTREVAIRLALGAQRGHVRRLVVGEVLMAASVGSVAGLVAGRWLSLSLEAYVFGVDAGDWPTAGITGLAAVVLMAGAALLPARRAVRLQPTEALRVD